MKKSIALNLVVLILFSLCGCTLADSKTTSETLNTSYTSSVAYSVQTSTEPTTVPSATESTMPVSTTEPTTEAVPTVSETQTTTQISTLPPTEATTPTTAKASKKATSAKKETTTQKAETTTKTETTKKQEPTESNTVKCTVEITCKTILNNKDKLKENKKAFVPKSGVILNSVDVTVPKGSSAFDVMKKACADNVCSDNCSFCRKNGIQLDFVYTPGYDSNYIRGIHQIYEKDCGTKSGWLYSVNGTFQNYGSSQYTVKDGDVITFAYTCDMGDDV